MMLKAGEAAPSLTDEETDVERTELATSHRLIEGPGSKLRPPGSRVPALSSDRSPVCRLPWFMPCSVFWTGTDHTDSISHLPAWTELRQACRGDLPCVCFQIRVTDACCAVINVL